MKYESIPVMSRDEIEAALKSDDQRNMCVALISGALYEENRRWVEELCFASLRDSRLEVKKCALTAMCHIVRINGEIDIGKLEEFRKSSYFDSEIAGAFDDLMDEIDVYFERKNMH
jgi:hypothetical protein